MELAQTRVALIAFLTGALACAKDLEDAEAVLQSPWGLARCLDPMDSVIDGGRAGVLSR